jgi:phosphatidylglycerophosphate synthase
MALSASKPSNAPPMSAARSAAPCCVVLVGQTDLRLWGLTPAERLRRQFSRHGIPVLSKLEEAPAGGESVLLLRADLVLDDPIVDGLVEVKQVIGTLPDPSGAQPVAAHVSAAEAPMVFDLLAGRPNALRPAGLRVVPVVALGAAYRKKLRKREVPYAARLSEQTRPALERRMFHGSYKGVTDLVTKYLWPVPAFWVTRAAAGLGLTPNIVTSVSLIFVIAALVLFLEGEFALGLVAAWIMTFLDTVDGKLARCTVTSSRIGDIFDHGIDLVHPPLWYVAWAYGLADTPYLYPPPLLILVVSVIVLGYIGGRVIEGAFKWRFGIDIHSWRHIDSWFRLITARRNPNMVLLTASVLLGRPDIGLLTVALWTVISLAFHLVRYGQAVGARRRRGRLTSWLAEPLPS